MQSPPNNVNAIRDIFNTCWSLFSLFQRPRLWLVIRVRFHTLHGRDLTLSLFFGAETCLFYLKRTSAAHSCSQLIFALSRQGFNRQTGRANGNGSSNQQRSQNSSPTTGNPTMPPLTSSTSFSSVGGSNSDSGANAIDHLEPEPTKFFFKEKYAKLGVRGNFMPLAAQPKYVDLGEWLAHQSRLGPLDYIFFGKLTALTKLSSNIVWWKPYCNASKRLIPTPGCPSAIPKAAP